MLPGLSFFEMRISFFKGKFPPRNRFFKRKINFSTENLTFQQEKWLFTGKIDFSRGKLIFKRKLSVPLLQTEINKRKTELFRLVDKYKTKKGFKLKI